jgi:hypothetical protein
LVSDPDKSRSNGLTEDRSPIQAAPRHVAGRYGPAGLADEATRGVALKKRLPLLLDAVNIRTCRTPMASGLDGLVPGVDTFRHVLVDAAIQTFGKGTIRRVVVAQATPA